MIHLIAIAISFVASMTHAHATPEPVREQASAFPIGISTVSPKRMPKLGHHISRAPMLRWTVVSQRGNRITRTLAGDPSGQTVTYTLE